MPDIICLGETLVDMVSTTPGLNLVQSPTFEKAAGGAPANVAAGCALLGASAGLISKVGTDFFGDFLHQTLWDAGVDLTLFTRAQDFATQLAFVALNERGVPEFTFHVRRPADRMLSDADLDPEYIAEAEIFHCGSISMIHDPARQATLHALDIAEEAGLLISLDPNLRPSLWPSENLAHEIICDLVSRCDVLKVNEEEMTFITGCEGLEDGIAALYEMGPELVLVTRGGAGCVALNAVTGVEVPGFPVPVEDTTGCGDTFVAAVLTGLLHEEHDVSELDTDALAGLCRFANAASALTATGKGAIPAMPGREEVSELLELGKITAQDEDDEPPIA